MTRIQQENAYQLGKTAFIKGKPCVPAKDDALMIMIRNINKFGEGVKLCKAWSNGWTAANLNAPIK